MTALYVLVPLALIAAFIAWFKAQERQVTAEMRHQGTTKALDDLRAHTKHLTTQIAMLNADLEDERKARAADIERMTAFIKVSARETLRESLRCVEDTLLYDSEPEDKEPTDG